MAESIMCGNPPVPFGREACLVMISLSEQRELFQRRSVFNVKWLLLAAATLAVIASPAQAYRRWGRSYGYSAMRARQRQYLNMAAAGQLNAARQVLAAAE